MSKHSERGSIRPATVVLMVSTLALAAAGLAYTAWTGSLSAQTVVKTGTVGVAVSHTGTDDDANVANDPSGTDTGGGTDLNTWGNSSDDPTEMYRSGGYPSSSGDTLVRSDKDVGRCYVDGASTATSLITQVENAYPGYACSTFATVTNTGSVPVKAGGATFTVKKGGVDGSISPIDDGYGTVPAAVFGGDAELTFDVSHGIACGTQLDPGDSIEVAGWVQVQDGASEGATYRITLTTPFVVWNAWDASMCTAP